MLGVLTSIDEEAPVSEAYAGQQFVGIDLHRRRSVIVRMTETGERLETVRISNDPEYLRQVMARAGEAPEVVLEATYGWYWAADALAELGATVHLAHPLGVKAFCVPAGEERRTRRRRSGRSAADGPAARGVDRPAGHPGAARAGAAPGQAGRAALEPEGQVHAVLAKCGSPGADERPVRRSRAASCWTRPRLPAESRARVASLRRLIDRLDFEIDLFARLVAGRLAPTPATSAVQPIPGIGPVLAAVFVAEIGDVTRFPGPQQLACGPG